MKVTMSDVVERPGNTSYRLDSEDVEALLGFSQSLYTRMAKNDVSPVIEWLNVTPKHPPTPLSQHRLPAVVRMKIVYESGPDCKTVSSEISQDIQLALTSREARIEQEDLVMERLKKEFLRLSAEHERVGKAFSSLAEQAVWKVRHDE